MNMGKNSINTICYDTERENDILPRDCQRNGIQLYVYVIVLVVSFTCKLYEYQHCITVEAQLSALCVAHS